MAHRHNERGHEGPVVYKLDQDGRAFTKKTDESGLDLFPQCVGTSETSGGGVYYTATYDKKVTVEEGPEIITMETTLYDAAANFKKILQAPRRTCPLFGTTMWFHREKGSKGDEVEASFLTGNGPTLEELLDPRRKRDDDENLRWTAGNLPGSTPEAPHHGWSLTTYLLQTPDFPTCILLPPETVATFRDDNHELTFNVGIKNRVRRYPLKEMPQTVGDNTATIVETGEVTAEPVEKHLELVEGTVEMVEESVETLVEESVETTVETTVEESVDSETLVEESVDSETLVEESVDSETLVEESVDSETLFEESVETMVEEGPQPVEESVKAVSKSVEAGERSVEMDKENLGKPHGLEPMNEEDLELQLRRQILGGIITLFAARAGPTILPYKPDT
ncbi:hypothetical protein C8R46DRAFT_1040922 [Mycena filopes]|nr:hypothetical protein C8R46DRAFT_1040922 [Mycena filopes]